MDHKSVAQPASYMCDKMGTFDVNNMFKPGRIPACGGELRNCFLDIQNIQ